LKAAAGSALREALGKAIRLPVPNDHARWPRRCRGIGARAVGGASLVCAIGFVVAGFAPWRGDPWAMPLIAGFALASLVLCVLGLPESAFGVLVNLAMLVVAGYFVLTGQVASGLAQR
jgi:hypothetical protein